MSQVIEPLTEAQLTELESVLGRTYIELMDRDRLLRLVAEVRQLRAQAKPFTDEDLIRLCSWITISSGKPEYLAPQDLMERLVAEVRRLRVRETQIRTAIAEDLDYGRLLDSLLFIMGEE